MNDLRLTVEGLTGKMTSLEAQVNDLQSEVKSLKVKNQELETIVEMKELEEPNLKMLLNKFFLYVVPGICQHFWHSEKSV